jgi:hypothetical protein
MTEANITGAIAYGLVANRRLDHVNPPANPTQPDTITIPADPIGPNQSTDVRNFLYSDYIKVSRCFVLDWSLTHSPVACHGLG